MRRTLLATCLVLLACVRAYAGVYYVTVAGLGGEPDYEQRFTAGANELDKVFKASGSAAHVITLTGANSTKAKLSDALASVAKEAKSDDDFVLVMIGHGTYDGVEYKFNLVGPDVTGAEIAAMCDKIPSRRQLIVNTTSASGGSVAALQRAGRGVIAATKSGTEKNATVFSRYWVEAMEDPEADVDKSDSVSALEAFEYANRKTAAFYESQKRLATEHATFEDTGHGDAVRAPSEKEGMLLSSFTVLRIGAARRRRTIRRDRRCSRKKKSWSRRLTN